MTWIQTKDPFTDCRSPHRSCEPDRLRNFETPVPTNLVLVGGVNNFSCGASSRLSANSCTPSCVQQANRLSNWCLHSAAFICETIMGKHATIRWGVKLVNLDRKPCSWHPAALLFCFSCVVNVVHQFLLQRFLRWTGCSSTLHQWQKVEDSGFSVLLFCSWNDSCNAKSEKKLTVKAADCMISWERRSAPLAPLPNPLFHSLMAIKCCVPCSLNPS